MKRVVLFSMPTDANKAKLAEALFPSEMREKRLAYMPSNGHNTKQVYTDYWKAFATDNKAEFVMVDNMLDRSAGEGKKILWANILLISGGNTFELLNNLRQSGLDSEVVEFAKKKGFVLAGFSAGAIVLTPTIEVASVPSGNDSEDLVDQNLVGIKDLTGLGIIDFEVFPHYVEDKDKGTLESYRSKSGYEVKEITDDGVIVLNLSR